MKSKITGGDTTLLFKTTVLGKYEVGYYRCNDTGFIQTEDPYWLEEAYASAITKMDIGLVKRNLDLAELTEPLIAKFFNHNASFLDYAGGYGLFTRLMRYKGFDFYNTDKFCQNLFAEFNDLKDYKKSEPFELVTAFEVFEHLNSPLPEIEEMLGFGDNLLFSTELVPKGVSQPQDWWYFSVETGQHIAFYTAEALEFIAKKFNKHFYTNGQTVHLFTKNKLSSNPFEPKARDPFFVRKARKFVKRFDEKSKVQKQSLMDKDWNDAKKRLGSK
jgi:2-polyprenyl-3-methyl-5-hydroxy-6-metoxy-1,4-benzoquinol methylase